MPPQTADTPRTSASRAGARSETEQVLRAETIDRITRFDGDGLPVVSLYLSIPPGMDSQAGARTKADSLLHEVRPLANDRSLDHDSRMSLRQDIERIEGVVRDLPIRPGTLAMFCCSRAGLLELVRLPRPVRDRIMVDATAWTRPMLAVLDEYERCCAVVIDRGNAEAWELYLDAMRHIGRLGDSRWGEAAREVSPRRMGAKAEELERRHFRSVAGHLDDLQRTDRYDVLVMGGHEDELGRFEPFLSHPLRERLGGTFPIDHDELRPATVRERAQAILDDRDLQRQRQAVAVVLERAAAGRPAAVGLEPCLWAGSVAAVETLLVQEGATSPGVVCEESGWLALSGETCPICGRRTRQAADVIDELAEAVLAEGGSVRQVRAETELSRLTAVASLRFPLPPAPEATQMPQA